MLMQFLSPPFFLPPVLIPSDAVSPFPSERKGCRPSFLPPTSGMFLFLFPLRLFCFFPSPPSTRLTIPRSFSPPFFLPLIEWQKVRPLRFFPPLSFPFLFPQSSSMVFFFLFSACVQADSVWYASLLFFYS